MTVVAVEAHLPHYAATVGEVEEELAVEERACRRWLAAARALAGESKLSVTEEIRTGPVARQVAGSAAHRHADLVIVGGRSHGLPRWGRPARRLIQTAPCAVLVVR
ncbi:universal stress protein [Streptomyces mirabilis]